MAALFFYSVRAPAAEAVNTRRQRNNSRERRRLFNLHRNASSVIGVTTAAHKVSQSRKSLTCVMSGPGGLDQTGGVPTCTLRSEDQT